MYTCTFIPGERTGNHSSIVSWRIPWTEEPGGLQFMGSQRVRHDWATDTIHIYMISRMNYPWPLQPFLLLVTQLCCLITTFSLYFLLHFLCPELFLAPFWWTTQIFIPEGFGPLIALLMGFCFLLTLIIGHKLIRIPPRILLSFFNLIVQTGWLDHYN